MNHMMLAGGMADEVVQLINTSSPSCTLLGTPNITGFSFRTTAQNTRACNGLTLLTKELKQFILISYIYSLAIWLSVKLFIDTCSCLVHSLLLEDTDTDISG